MWSEAAAPPTLLILPSWSLWPRGMLQPYTWVLGFSQWCLVYGGLLVGLVSETEVGNNLCCHLDDITPVFIFILIVCLLWI